MDYVRCVLFPAVLFAVIFVVAGCSTGSDAANPNIVAVDPTIQPDAADTSSRVGSASTQASLVADEASGTLAPFTEGDVFDAVNDFVDARDGVVVGDLPLSALEGLVSDGVLAQLEAQRDENLANIENYDVDARVSYTTFTYVLDAQRSGDKVAALTCLERWAERPTGKQQIVFVDQAMIFDVVGDQLHLSEVRTAHDGERVTEGLTCFVGVMGERAVDAARAGVETLEAISANPTLAATTDFESLFSAAALNTFAPLADNVDLDRRRVSPVEVRYTPLGIDPSRGVDFIGAVSVCRYYPEGVYDEVLATGERVEVNGAYSPGTSVEDIVYVHIEPQRRSQGGLDHFWDFSAEVNRGCWS